MREQVNRKRADGRDDTCRRGDRGPRRVRSLSEIVRNYKQRFRRRATAELRFFAGMQSLDRVVTEAGLARMPNGKRWSHQRRIPAGIIGEAERRLHRVNLKTAPSFDELLQTVDNAVHSLRGIGELYTYDTALRIGAYLRKLPERVYLHAGTRVGAGALGFEIEDVLCIYKEWLATAHRG